MSQTPDEQPIPMRALREILHRTGAGEDATAVSRDVLARYREREAPRDPVTGKFTADMNQKIREVWAGIAVSDEAGDGEQDDGGTDPSADTAAGFDGGTQSGFTSEAPRQREPDMNELLRQAARGGDR